MTVTNGLLKSIAHGDNLWAGRVAFYTNIEYHLNVQLTGMATKVVKAIGQRYRTGVIKHLAEVTGIITMTVLYLKRKATTCCLF